MILITAFEPWGWRKKNQSKEVALKLKQDLKKLNLKTIKVIILPVDKEGIESYKSFLHYEKPDYIINMGHVSFSKDFRIESTAYMGNSEKSSLFARYIALLLNIKLTNKIGRDKCNDIYWNSLEANENSLFIHIGSKCDVDYALKQLKRIIIKCKEVKK